MEDIFKSIISFEEVLSDFKKVDSIIQQYGEAIVIAENQFKYVILPFSKYQNYSNRKEEYYLDKEGREMLTKLLNGIGKEFFVKYYYDFKNNNDPFVFIEETITDNSKRSRMSKARAIFRDGLEIDALNIIANSTRTDRGAIEAAKEILSKETQK